MLSLLFHPRLHAYYICHRFYEVVFAQWGNIYGRSWRVKLLFQVINLLWWNMNINLEYHTFIKCMWLSIISLHSFTLSRLLSSSWGSCEILLVTRREHKQANKNEQHPQTNPTKRTNQQQNSTKPTTNQKENPATNSMFGSKKTTTSTSTRDGAASQSRSHELPHHLLRALQFLSALISLILFSLRVAKIVRLVGHASHSNGAVEGILAAAVLYTLIVMALSLGLRATGSNVIRYLFVILDILFVGAFIAVAVLTSPKRHGSSAPCTSSAKVNGHIPGGTDCKLPWGTFILAIVSTYVSLSFFLSPTRPVPSLNN